MDFHALSKLIWVPSNLTVWKFKKKNSLAFENSKNILNQKPSNEKYKILIKCEKNSLNTKKTRPIFKFPFLR